MPFYENVFIVRQDVSTTQVETMATEFADLVKAQGGEVKKTEHWGLKSLPFRIRKNRKGHYVLLNLDAPPAAVAELERTMRINEDVLRYLTIRVDELEEGPSAMLRARDERPRREGGFGDRGDRGGGFRDRGERGGFRDERGPRTDEVPAVGGEA